MALPPKFAGFLFAPGNPGAVHTIELYLDYVCPFSKKMFETLYTHVLPALKTTPTRQVAFIFRPQVQPWHPSSTLCHEAALAVQRLAPGAFWPFSAALFARAADFYDVGVAREGRNETYARLARLAAEACRGDGGGASPRASSPVTQDAVMDLLRVAEVKRESDDALNTGNQVTNDLKVVVKMARLVSVHVSPTVVVDGVVDNSISSSFTAEQWEAYLEKLCA